MVSSYVQLLASRYQGKLGADADEFIHYIVDGSKRMQKFIQDLLAYSRVSTEQKELEMVDCEWILQQTLVNLSASIRESGAAITHDPLPSVAGDSTQFLQLFQNLLSNGIKFGGPRTPRIHISAVAQSGCWLFSVSDNGVGIDPRDQERIFMIFERVRPLRDDSGTGIGLAICKKIVDGHHGRIWVDSRPGEGATFRFTISVSRDEPSAQVGWSSEKDRQ